ncbi:uncharacterized protein LOC115305098 [Suricata suricatta]|uniref:uncharacterized protein LOC115305098 n=1 Tax=Suricata suricatta TaxID=37032 RepID=UPI001155B6CC|nr:uncharacterized protein LOC115305098 [Suricata suricatta]
MDKTECNNIDEGIGSYPAELGSKSIGHENAEKSNCNGDDNTWQLPIFPSPSVFGFPTLPPPLLLTNTQGCDPPAGGCGDLCLGPAPHAKAPPPPPPRSPLAHTPGVSKALEARRPPLPPRPPPADSRPSFPLRRPRLQLHPRRGGSLYLGGLSASFLLGLPPDTKRGASTRRGCGWGRLPRRSPKDTHTPPHPGNAWAPRGSRWTRGATGTRELPTPRLPLSTSRPGLSLQRPPKPPAPALGPKHPPDSLGSGSAGQQEKPRAVFRHQLTSKCGGRVAKRGAEAELLCRRPRRPDAGPGPSGWRSRGASEAQASAAAFRLSPRVRSLWEGPRVPHALPSPPDNMAPGPPGRAGSPLIPSEEPGREESERARKKTFIETIQPAAAEERDPPRELPPPPPELFAAGSATPAGGGGGRGGAGGPGRGLEGGAGYPRETPSP